MSQSGSVLARAGASLALAFTSLSGAHVAGAQPPSNNGAWFGLTLPPHLTPHAIQVIGDRPAASAIAPVGEGGYTELQGASISRDLETIVGFAVASRESREVGDGGLWGRISGFPSGRKTIGWAAQQFRNAGISDVQEQQFQQDKDASLWMPLRWEVRLLGSPKFGPGSTDVVLDSAMPLSSRGIPAEGLTAPLVYVGAASVAELTHIDVKGKVAVQHVTPQGHTVFARDPAGPRARDLLARGALAVLTILDLPGNMRSRDIGCGGGVCFNLGGRDGHFLEAAMSAAAKAGTLDDLRVKLQIESKALTGLTASNGVAILPGTTRRNEKIILNAHADGWFDGAGDNGDGLAVLIALARHFAKPENRLSRTLVLVASAGHHSSGLSGPQHFVAMNPGLIENLLLIVNLEHTSQRNITPARSESEDGYQEWVMDSHEAPIVAGITNLSPFLEGLVRQGIERYGTNFVAAPSRMASGEGGTYGRVGTVFTAMQGPPLYHTTGEVLGMVSTPGLERMARFMAFFVKQVDGAAAEKINPPK